MSKLSKLRQQSERLQIVQVKSRHRMDDGSTLKFDQKRMGLRYDPGPLPKGWVDVRLGNKTITCPIGLDMIAGYEKKHYPNYMDIPVPYRARNHPLQKVAANRFFDGSVPLLNLLEQSGHILKGKYDYNLICHAVTALLHTFDVQSETKFATVAWFLGEITNQVGDDNLDKEG